MAKFNPTEEAKELHKAMRGLGTDEATIIRIMGNKQSTERCAIAKHYKAQYGKSLEDAFKSDLSGNFYKVCRDMCLYLVDFDARQVRYAVEGAGTDEQCIIDTLVPRNNAMIIAIKESYRKTYNRDIEKDVVNDTSGYFKKGLVAILQGLRDECPASHAEIDKRKVEEDADTLYNAGENRLGTDEDVFNSLLCHRSFMHLYYVSQAYNRRHSRSGVCCKPQNLQKMISKETSGSYRKLLEAIVSFSSEPIAYFARIFHDTMKGLGTNDRRLQRIAISQERNMSLIREAFQNLYGESLVDWIKGDTSGDYKEMLLALVNQKLQY